MILASTDDGRVVVYWRQYPAERLPRWQDKLVTPRTTDVWRCVGRTTPLPPKLS